MPKKTTFLSKPEKSKSGKEFRHLRIIVSDSDKNNEQIVVSVTSLKFDNQDKSCIIHPGEHPFIKHKSIIDFKRTKIMSTIDIINGINKGWLIKKEDISDTLLTRIQNALKQSKFISAEGKSLFRYL